MYTFLEQLDQESRKNFLADHNLRFIMDYNQDIIRMACAYVKFRIHKQRINFDTNVADRAGILDWICTKSYEAMDELRPRIRRRDMNKLLLGTRTIEDSYRKHLIKNKEEL